MRFEHELTEARCEILELEELIVAYIRHVGHMEGVAFIEGCDHCHDQVTDEQWEKLKKFDQLAKA